MWWCAFLSPAQSRRDRSRGGGRRQEKGALVIGATGICLCSSETERLGDAVWDPQKLPGAEVGEPFRKGASPSHPASILASWPEAVCPSALRNGPRHPPSGAGLQRPELCEGARLWALKGHRRMSSSAWSADSRTRPTSKAAGG